MVPEGAEVCFDECKTTQTGMHRLFTTPCLEYGCKYFYEVHACWKGSDGNEVHHRRKVHVAAGEVSSVMFLVPQPLPPGKDAK